MPRFRLSEDDAWDALAAAHTGLYTTLRKDGRPVTLPVWHVVIDRAIYVRTPSAAVKLKRIRNDPRGSFVVETGTDWAELAAVTVAVNATILDDPDFEARVSEAIDAKYAGHEAPLDRLPQAVRDRYADSKVVRLEVEGRLNSWNNRALLGDEGPIDWS